MNLNSSKKLTHIYQEQYSNWNSSGLGDFIRGSFFLMQICDKLNIEYEISFKNHILHTFLKNSNMNEYTGISDMSIIKFLHNNFIQDIDVISREISYKTLPENTIIKYFLNYIINIAKTDKHNNKNINIICFPLHREIDIKHKEYMKNLFEPTDIIKQYVLNQFAIMKLDIGDYNIIHIRCGDHILIKNINDYTLFNTIYNKLEKIISNNLLKEEYLIISDSNELKKKLKIKFPSLKINTDSNVVHIGEGTKNTEQTIKDLLLDFYFMAFSKNIIGLSYYPHGSGLSLWCSKMYDIPYKCYYLL
jgi:hypothetical protein